MKLRVLACCRRCLVLYCIISIIKLFHEFISCIMLCVCNRYALCIPFLLFKKNVIAPIVDRSVETWLTVESLLLLPRRCMGPIACHCSHDDTDTSRLSLIDTITHHSCLPMHDLFALSLHVWRCKTNHAVTTSHVAVAHRPTSTRLVLSISAMHIVTDRSNDSSMISGWSGLDFLVCLHTY